MLILMLVLVKLCERFDVMVGFIEYVCDKNDVVCVFCVIEDVLVVCVVWLEGEMLVMWVLMMFGVLYEVMDGGLLYFRVNELLDVVMILKLMVFVKVLVFKVLMWLGEKFGDKLFGNVLVYVWVVCVSVRLNDDVWCRRAALRFFAATCEKSAGGLDGKGIVVVYKMFVWLEYDRLKGVCVVFVDVIGVFVLVWVVFKEKGVVFASDLDITGVVDWILYVLKDDSVCVWDVVLGVFVSVILVCVIVLVEDWMNNEDSFGESRFARAVSTFLYGLFMNVCCECFLMN